MSAPFLISKTIDPIFAMGVGVTAAYVRVNREEKEKGKSTQQSIDSFKRRIDLAWNGETTADGAVKGRS